MFYQQRNYWNNRKNQKVFQQGNHWDNREQYHSKPKMRSILEKIEDENVLNLALTLIEQIRENDRSHRLAKLEDGKLFKKHQDYIKKVENSMQIRKEFMIYQTLLLQMIGWVFGMIEYKTRHDADAESLEIRPIQITLENLWDAKKDSTIYHIFEVHQFEMKITRKDLCDRLSIGERMYRPPNKEQRTEHLNDDIDYRKQIIDNHQIWEALETAANKGQFQNILCAAQGMEAISNLGASHLGSPNPNPKPNPKHSPHSTSSAFPLPGPRAPTLRRSTPVGAVGPPRTKTNNTANVDFQPIPNTHEASSTTIQNLTSRICKLEKQFANEVSTYTSITAGVHSQYFLLYDKIRQLDPATQMPSFGRSPQ